jgi:hypothetical protein
MDNRNLPKGLTPVHKMILEITAQTTEASKIGTRLLLDLVVNDIERSILKLPAMEVLGEETTPNQTRSFLEVIFERALRDCQMRHPFSTGFAYIHKSDFAKVKLSRLEKSDILEATRLALVNLSKASSDMITCCTCKWISVGSEEYIEIWAMYKLDKSFPGPFKK